jgi:hypothetical protein
MKGKRPTSPPRRPARTVTKHEWVVGASCEGTVSNSLVARLLRHAASGCATDAPLRSVVISRVPLAESGSSALNPTACVAFGRVMTLG